MTEIIDTSEAKRKAQIGKAKVQMAKMKRGGGSIKSNRFPDDWEFDDEKLADFKCPGCDCKDTVVKLLEDEHPKKQQREYNAAFQKKKKNARVSRGPVPQKTGYPAQQYWHVHHSR